MLNIDKKRDELIKLLEEFKSAVNQPTLYVSEFFDHLKNKIDIQFCKILNETNKSHMNEQIYYQQQAELIRKVQELESLCSSEINEESMSYLNVTIEETEKDLNRPNLSQDELCKIDRVLSNELIKIHKILFQNKFMFFVNDIEIIEAYDKLKESMQNEESDYLKCLENLSKRIKEKNLSGLFVTVDECFFRKELFQTE